MIRHGEIWRPYEGSEPGRLCRLMINVEEKCGEKKIMKEDSKSLKNRREPPGSEKKELVHVRSHRILLRAARQTLAMMVMGKGTSRIQGGRMDDPEDAGKKSPQ